jgi:hypothetical protein
MASPVLSTESEQLPIFPCPQPYRPNGSSTAMTMSQAYTGYRAERNALNERIRVARLNSAKRRSQTRTAG